MPSVLLGATVCVTLTVAAFAVDETWAVADHSAYEVPVPASTANVTMLAMTASLELTPNLNVRRALTSAPAPP